MRIYIFSPNPLDSFHKIQRLYKGRRCCRSQDASSTLYTFEFLRQRFLHPPLGSWSRESVRLPLTRRADRFNTLGDTESRDPSPREEERGWKKNSHFLLGNLNFIVPTRSWDRIIATEKSRRIFHFSSPTTKQTFGKFREIRDSKFRRIKLLLDRKTRDSPFFRVFQLVVYLVLTFHL